jgi:hypothetical protein
VPSSSLAMRLLWCLLPIFEYIRMLMLVVDRGMRAISMAWKMVGNVAHLFSRNVTAMSDSNTIEVRLNVLESHILWFE